MDTFVQHTTDTAPEQSRPMLEGAIAKLGFLPNLYAHLAEAPAALEAYFGLAAQFDKTSLSPAERQVVLLAASVENGCEFCVAAHSMMSGMAKVPDNSVQALRAAGSLPDSRLDALAGFTRSMVRDRGWPSAESSHAFYKAGFDRRQALEVVLGVSMKTLSNYANHLTGTGTNPELAAHAWTRPA
ncbi:MAG: carboxymuconolactone decarboxylase family protein [Pseudomonadota bacterium]|nr:carboxymuconolactone decarboxylase family protein [Pseudomonadota bacterium]